MLDRKLSEREIEISTLFYELMQPHFHYKDFVDLNMSVYFIGLLYFRKEKKKNPNKFHSSKKDPGIPANCPFKDQVAFQHS